MALICRLATLFSIATFSILSFASEPVRQVIVLDKGATSAIRIEHKEGRLFFQFCKDVYGPTTVDQCVDVGPEGGIPSTETAVLSKRIQDFVAKRAAHHNYAAGLAGFAASIAGIPFTFGGSALLYPAVVAEGRRQDGIVSRKTTLGNCILNSLPQCTQDLSYQTASSKEELVAMLSAVFGTSACNFEI